MLSDRDLRELLPQMAIVTEDSTRPFQPDVQVQPCSIDLRLDRCFWKPRKPLRGKIIDLRQSGTGALDMNRLFRAHWATGGEGITLRPGEMILGRTFEKLAMPNGFAGRILGRSSYARLGLSVHCTGDFINPGWNGRMPLQLVNHGAVPIILTPYIHVCQLVVLRASSLSDRPYGTADAGHIYVDDDGGPSRFWLDRSLRKVQETFRHGQVSEQIQAKLFDVVGKRDTALMDRFSEFFSSLHTGEITSAREVMERFAKRDAANHEWKVRGLKFARWFCLLPVGTLVSAVTKQPFGKLPGWVWAVSILLLLPGLWAQFLAREPDEPFTAKEVDEFFPPTR